MVDIETIILPADQIRELLALLQAIRREAERHKVVEVVELAKRGAAIAENALGRET